MSSKVSNHFKDYRHIILIGWFETIKTVSAMIYTIMIYKYPGVSKDFDLNAGNNFDCINFDDNTICTIKIDAIIVYCLQWCTLVSTLQLMWGVVARQKNFLVPFIFIEILNWFYIIFNAFRLDVAVNIYIWAPNFVCMFLKLIIFHFIYLYLYLIYSSILLHFVDNNWSIGCSGKYVKFY